MNKPFLIGITGGSGSGKTTFIKALRDLFSEEELCIVSQDDYYRPKEQQDLDKKGVSNFDMPDSIYNNDFLKDLGNLLDGNEVARKEYTFNNDVKNPKTLIFKPAPILIVEGLFIFHHNEIRNLLDLKIFVHAKENLKVIRRIHRDQVERNYPLDDVLYRYQHHVSPAFEKYIEPYKELADVVINNNDNFDRGLDMMAGFMKSKLA